MTSSRIQGTCHLFNGHVPGTILWNWQIWCSNHELKPSYGVCKTYPYFLQEFAPDLCRLKRLGLDIYFDIAWMSATISMWQISGNRPGNKDFPTIVFKLEYTMNGESYCKHASTRRDTLVISLFTYGIHVLYTVKPIYLAIAFVIHYRIMH